MHGRHTRALSVENRLAIHELIGEYCHYEDNGDARNWASLFTSDGGFVGSNDKYIIGHEALEAFARKRWDEKPQVRNWIHWVGSVVIRPTEDGAETCSYQMVIEKHPDGDRVKKMSGKKDELREENGIWRFYRRHATGLPVMN